MRHWGWVLFCLLASAASAGTSVLPDGAVLIDAAAVKPDAAALAVDAGAVLAKAAAGDSDAAFAALQGIDDPLRFELTAARVVESLQAAPVPGGDALLAKLESIAPRVFLRHAETASDWFLPAFDVAGKARSARLLLARNARRDAWLARLAADPKAAIPQAAKKADSDALAAAIGRASPALLARLVDETAKADAALPSAAQTALAERSRDVRAWRLALAKSEPVDVLPLFAKAHTVLGDAQARAWLQDAASDPVYASAAAMALLALSDAAAYAALDDAGQGAEAAATLAQRPDVVTLADRLLADPAASPRRVANIALMLRLADSDEARARLQRLREDPRLPAHVRAELQR